MKKLLWLLLLLVVVAIGGLTLIILRGGLPEINGAWREIGVAEPATLTVSGGRIAYRSAHGENGNFTYAVEGEREAAVVALRFGEGAPYEYMLFHRIMLGETELPLLTLVATNTESGVPALSEFVRPEDAAMLPDGYISAVLQGVISSLAEAAQADPEATETPDT